MVKVTTARGRPAAGGHRAGEPPISLVLCTINTESRAGELERLAASLRACQLVEQVELVVVVQDGRVEAIEQLFARSGVATLRIVESPPGLSLGRNIGLAACTGWVVGFPDDDCWYAPETLRRVVEEFDCRPGHLAVHGRSLDDHGRPIARFRSDAHQIRRAGVFETTCSIAMFYRRDRLVELGGFDESLGLGSNGPWQGAEDYELPLRAIARGHRLWYSPDLVVGHPQPDVEPALRLVRARSQAPSFGRVMRRGGLSRSEVFVRLVRPVGGMALALVSGPSVAQCRYHATVALGRLRGYLATALEDRRAR